MENQKLSQSEIFAELTAANQVFDKLTAEQNRLDREISWYESVKNRSTRFVIPALVKQRDAISEHLETLYSEIEELQAQKVVNLDYIGAYNREGEGVFMANVPYEKAWSLFTKTLGLNSFADLVRNVDWVEIDVPMSFADFKEDDWQALVDHLEQRQQPC